MGTFESHRQYARLSARRWRGDEGVTLIEVVVSFVVLLLVILPLGYLVTNEVAQAAAAKNQLAALGIAEKWVEILGTAQDPPPTSGTLAVDADVPLVPKLPDGTSVPTETRGDTVFTIRSEYTWTGTQDASRAPDLCLSGGAQVLNLTVTVSWGRGHEITDTTVLNFPAPGIPQYGFYRLQISGATATSDAGGKSWSDRVKAIPVTISHTSPSSSVTIYPDQYGCVFAELVPGSYTVAVGDPQTGQPLPTDQYGTPSFVEDLATDGSQVQPLNINPVPSADPVTIVAGQTTPLTTLYYDEGSTFGVSYPSSTATADGVICPGVAQATCLSAGEGTISSLGQSPVTATLSWTSGSTWSSASLPPSPSVTRIASTTCAGPTTACIEVGYGYSGTTPEGVILSSNPASPGNISPDAVPAATSGGTVTSLSQVICPSTTACVAWGTGSTGPVALAGTISGSGDTWNPIALPTSLTSLSQVACTSALTCVAVGNGGGTGLAVSGPIYGASGPPSAGAWASGNAVSGATVSALSQVVCPSTQACMAIGTGQVGTGPAAPIVISGTPANPLLGLGSTLNWTVDANPAGTAPTSFSELVCPSSTTCLVNGVGTVGTGSPQALIYSGAPGAATLANDAVAATTTSLTQVVCPSSSVCIAIGIGTASGSPGPIILSGAIASPDTWSSPAAGGIPTAVTSVSAVACPNSTTCAIAASTTSATGNPVAAILSGTPGASASWANSSIPTADANTMYLTGIACTPTSGTATCSAVGASPTGAVIMTSTGGPGGSWNDDTVDAGLTLTGSPTSNIPIELANGGLTNQSGSNGAWNPVPATPTGTANSTSISDIFPFDDGYAMFAGDCAAEDTTNGPGTTNVPTIPGTTVATPATTVPLAVLPIQVNSSTGTPEPGDVLTLTTDITNTPGCQADTYRLQSSGPDGLSRTEVPFGAFTLTVQLPGGGSNSYPVTVAPGSVTVGTSQYPLPLSATVVGP